MSRPDRKLYMPPRNLVGSLVPIAVAAWYFIDKVGHNTPVRLAIILTAVAAQIVVAVVSTRTRTTRKPFFWGVYDFLTGEGRLPFRLLVNGMAAIAIIALGFEISGFRSTSAMPASFIVRFVEVNLYWTALNFLGTSDSALEPLGFGRSLTVLATLCGLVFWGMFISILINKHMEIQNKRRNRARPSDMDEILYNETGPVSPPD
jgi:hypothetical protein